MTKNKRMAILEHDKSNHLARIQFLEKKLSALEEYLSIAFDDGIPVIPKMSRYKKVCKKCNHYPEPFQYTYSGFQCSCSCHKKK